MLVFLEESRRAGVLGPGPVEFHVAHAAGFAEAAEHVRAAAGLDPHPDAFADLGTGAGIPGLVLAARWPRASGVLLDASEARTAALGAVVGALGWPARVRVVRARAEAAGRDPSLRGRFPVVVARGFGTPPVIAECAAPLLEEGGVLVVSEPPFEPSLETAPSRADPTGAPTWGPDAWDRSRWPDDGLAQLGLRPEGWYRSAAGYQVLRAAVLCPDRFPRRDGVPAKRPLWG